MHTNGKRTQNKKKQSKNQKGRRTTGRSRQNTTTNNPKKKKKTWVDRATELPGGLAFTDIAEYSLVDDLTGEPLDATAVTIAEREEVTEMYRRTVWTEAPTSDCFRDTGKPPIPVRWVSTNKGDTLHPNIRCRLVAKHLAAKYGGKDMEDLFAAMPP